MEDHLRRKAWNEGEAGGIEIACQGLSTRTNIFGGNSRRTVSSGLLFDIALFLTLYRFFRSVLRPLQMPFVSQLLAGFIVGPTFDVYKEDIAANKASLFTVASVLGNIGFFFHLFLLGLEINIGKLRKVDRNAFIISYAGVLTSAAFSIATYLAMQSPEKEFLPKGLPMILMFNASNFLLSTASHLNDLHISNSKLGQMASSASMVTDMTFLLLSVTLVNIIMPLVSKDGAEAVKALMILYYILLFFGFRPLIMYLVGFKREGIPLKRTNFVMIVLLILLMALLGESLDQKYSPFLVALTLPEEPLATVLTERLDPFTSNILFPFFVISCGMPLTLPSMDIHSYIIATLLFMGYIGKFVGVAISAWFLRVPFSQGIALALIMSARGVLDFANLDISLKNESLTRSQYTLVLVHASITMGVLLPFVRSLYEPSRQYSTIMRRGVIDLQENSEVLLILVCIHKEESLPGLIRLLKAFYSTHENPISVLALQLLQLTGRCAMPIMAPLHEVSAISSLRSNLERSNRTVNCFLQLERETERVIRAQHYVAMSSYATMHNDICNLAYEKAVGLVILPFHITWGSDGSIIDSSLAIKDVNNMVLKKAPCSVGILVDRMSFRKRVTDEDAYFISVIFIGGPDDYEALAYGKLFANHPCVRLNVIWIQPPKRSKNDALDNEVMKQFYRSCMSNERISFEEVIVTNGTETIKVLGSMKDKVDLVVTGIYHNPLCVPLFGLADELCEYPELGVLGDICAIDFEFSLLIVQQEPQNEVAFDFDIKEHRG